MNTQRMVGVIGTLICGFFFAYQAITVFEEIQSVKAWYAWLAAANAISVNQSLLFGILLTLQDFLFLALLMGVLVSVYVAVELWYKPRKRNNIEKKESE